MGNAFIKLAPPPPHKSLLWNFTPLCAVQSRELKRWAFELGDKMNHWKALKADTYRQYRCYSFKKLFMGAIKNTTFRVVVTFRLCNIFANSHRLMKVLLPFFLLLHKFSSHIAYMHFPRKIIIDEGLALTHSWGTKVGAGVKIGKNVTILHGVTIGQRHKISKDGQQFTEFPTIEDEVWIGPNAIIVGGVTIGRGSRIIGGALVIDDVPPFSKVMGNPSKIVKNNCIPDVMNPAP